MAQRIMIVSGKGGAGKSTVCLGLAAGLASLGKRVLILEADTGFRGLDILLSLDDKAIYDLGDLLEGNSSIAETVLRHGRTGIDLICAPNDPEYLPHQGRFEELLGQLESSYDFVLFDCGAGFGAVQGLVTRLAQQALVVTLPTHTSVRAAAKVSALLHGKGVERQRLIINRIPKKPTGDQLFTDLDEVINLVGVRLVGAIPEGPMRPLPERGEGIAAEEMYRIAERLCGKRIELAILR